MRASGVGRPMEKGHVTELSRLLSVEELATLLQVPVNTVYQWRHRGEGPRPIRLGRHLRFDPIDVARWLETRKAAS